MKTVIAIIALIILFHYNIPSQVFVPMSYDCGAAGKFTFSFNRKYIEYTGPKGHQVIRQKEVGVYFVNTPAGKVLYKFGDHKMSMQFGEWSITGTCDVHNKLLPWVF